MELRFGLARAASGNGLLQAGRQPGGKIKPEAIEAYSLQASTQNLAELCKIRASFECVGCSSDADTVRDRMTLIQREVGNATKFQKFVIAKLLHTDQHAGRNDRQDDCQYRPSRIQQKQAAQAEARAHAIQHEDGLFVWKATA